MIIAVRLQGTPIRGMSEPKIADMHTAELAHGDVEASQVNQWTSQGRSDLDQGSHVKREALQNTNIYIFSFYGYRDCGKSLKSPGRRTSRVKKSRVLYSVATQPAASSWL